LASKKQSDFFHAIFTIIGVFRDFKREMGMDGSPSRPFSARPAVPPYQLTLRLRAMVHSPA
jgi:hypothetical protein